MSSTVLTQLNSHEKKKKSIHAYGFLFISHDKYGATLNGTLGVTSDRWSSALMTAIMKSWKLMKTGISLTYSTEDSNELDETFWRYWNATHPSYIVERSENLSEIKVMTSFFRFRYF